MAEALIDSWEKFPRESAKAYAAFVIYRNMGPGRSLIAAFKHSHAGAKSASGQWTRWCGAFDWRRRAEDYDIWYEREQRREREKEHAEELRSYRNRQKTLAQVTLAAATALLQKAGARLAKVEPDEIPAKNLGSIFRSAALLANASTEAEGVALSVGDLLQEFYADTENDH